MDGEDARHLDRARVLGERGWGRVHPNPMVGCVVVAGDEVVGEGWHREFGGPHAEVEALRAAGERARGATAFVSLEPCRHEGKTPPCTDALVAAGVARVVFGAKDPGEHSGGGAGALREAGVRVTGPMYSDVEARAINPGFFHRATDRPWTVLKLAISLDAAVSRSADRPTPLSGPEAWARVHRLRSGMDAILVGAGTVRADAPRLTVRGDFEPRTPPIRVVVDPGDGWFRRARASGLADSPGSLLDPEAPPVWVAVREDRAEARSQEMEGIRVLPVPGDRTGLDPRALLCRLREEKIDRLLCEGGAGWGRALLDASLVDRLILVTAPVSLGPGAVSAPPFAEAQWRPARDPMRLGADIWCEWDHCDETEVG